MAFLDLYSRLTGHLPGLSPFLAQDHINDAWIDICNRRAWSWLRRDGSVACPAQITAGTVAITTGSTTVTAGAAASAALVAQQATSNPTVTNLQIRFGATSPSAGQVYNIVEYNATNPAAVVLTLDRAVVEATNATAGYQCYRCYVVSPLIPGLRFLGWESFTDMVNGWQLVSDRGYTSAQLDRLDPQRMAQGQAYQLATYQADYTSNALTGATAPNPNQAAGTPLYELWPHPTSGQTFYVRMRVKGTRFFQPTEELPTNIIEEQTILQWALGTYSYPFALANRAHFPAFKDTDMPTLIRTSLTTAERQLQVAARQDQEQALTSVYHRGHGLRGGRGDTRRGRGWPVDSNYMQSHLIPF